jgi:hypothetical protein
MRHFSTVSTGLSICRLSLGIVLGAVGFHHEQVFAELFFVDVTDLFGESPGRLREFGAVEDGEGYTQAHAGGCLGIRDEGVEGIEGDGAEFLHLIAQGEDIFGTGLADGLRKGFVGVQPFIDGGAVQSGGLRSRGDGGALGQRQDYLLLHGG